MNKPCIVYLYGLISVLFHTGGQSFLTNLQCRGIVRTRRLASSFCPCSVLKTSLDSRAIPISHEFLDICHRQFEILNSLLQVSAGAVYFRSEETNEFGPYFFQVASYLEPNGYTYSPSEADFAFSTAYLSLPSLNTADNSSNANVEYNKPLSSFTLPLTYGNLMIGLLKVWRYKESVKVSNGADNAVVQIPQVLTMQDYMADLAEAQAEAEAEAEAETEANATAKAHADDDGSVGLTGGATDQSFHSDTRNKPNAPPTQGFAFDSSKCTWSEAERALVASVASTVALSAVMDQRQRWAIGLDADHRDGRYLEQTRQMDSPLVSIRSFAKLLLRSLPLTDTIDRELVQNILIQVDYLTHLLYTIQNYDQYETAPSTTTDTATATAATATTTVAVDPMLRPPVPSEGMPPVAAAAAMSALRQSAWVRPAYYRPGWDAATDADADAGGGGGGEGGGGSEEVTTGNGYQYRGDQGKQKQHTTGRHGSRGGQGVGGNGGFFVASAPPYSALDGDKKDDNTKLTRGNSGSTVDTKVENFCGNYEEYDDDDDGDDRDNGGWA